MAHGSPPGDTCENEVVTLIPALRVFARSLCRQPADADDLVQETLVRALEHIDQFTPGTHLRAWLFTIMRNRFYTNTQKSARERTGAEDCVAGTPWVPATQEWAVRGQELLAALNNLPAHYRETLVLVVVLGESYENAARIFDCEIGTIKSRVNRARSMIRQALDEKV